MPRRRKIGLTVQGRDLHSFAEDVAALHESARFREHFSVLALDGTKLGYVYRSAVSVAWKLDHCSKTWYRTLEAALEAVFRKARRR